MRLIDVDAISYLQANYLSVLLVSGLAMLRPLGLTFGFVGFLWALPQVTVLRTAIALVLVCPLIVAEFAAILAVVSTSSWLTIGALSIKELGVGYAIGFAASIPFWAVQFAGAIIDGSRGESNPGAPDPAGGEMTTLARFYIVVALLVFSASGGIWLLLSTLYKSYTVWSVTAFIPPLAPAAVATALDMLTHMIVLAIVIASPLALIMLASDFASIVAGKVFKGFNPLDASFGIKSIITVLTLPIMAMVLVHTFRDILVRDFDIITQVRAFLP